MSIYENGSDFCAFNSNATLFSYGFNKALRSEIKIYTVDQQQEQSSNGLKLSKTIKLNKNEKIKFLRFLSFNKQQQQQQQQQSKSNSGTPNSTPKRNNKRKLDESTTSDTQTTPQKQTQLQQQQGFPQNVSYMIVVLQDGSILVYSFSDNAATNDNSDGEVAPITTIKRKSEIKSIAVSQALTDDSFWILDANTKTVEKYSVFSSKPAHKVKVNNLVIDDKEDTTVVLVYKDENTLQVIQSKGTANDDQEVSITSVTASTESGEFKADGEKAVVDFGRPVSGIRRAQISIVHDDLLYILLNNDSHVYVYSIEGQRIINKLNASSNDDDDGDDGQEATAANSDILDFTLFKIKNTEYAVVLKGDNSFEAFKCAFRKNASNTNPSLEVQINEEFSDLNINGVVVDQNSGELVIAVEFDSKVVKVDLPKLISSRKGSVTIEVDVEKRQSTSDEVSNSPSKKDAENGNGNAAVAPAKKKVVRRRRNNKLRTTGNATIDELVLEFKAVQNEPSKLVKFSVDNNYNVLLIKTILKTASNEQVDSILNSYLKFFFKNEDDKIDNLTYLKLNNWFRLIFLVNGAYIVKHSTTKRLHLLQKFQAKIKEDTNHLSTLLNLQGKLTLLKSQYELRNQDKLESQLSGLSLQKGANFDGDDDDDDDDEEDNDGEEVNDGNLINGSGHFKANKTHKQLLNNVIKGTSNGGITSTSDAANGDDGIQVIDKDEIIYDNGEIDEADQSDGAEDDEAEKQQADDDESDDE